MARHHAGRVQKVGAVPRAAAPGDVLFPGVAGGCCPLRVRIERPAVESGGVEVCGAVRELQLVEGGRAWRASRKHTASPATSVTVTALSAFTIRWAAVHRPPIAQDSDAKLRTPVRPAEPGLPSVRSLPWSHPFPSHPQQQPTTTRADPHPVWSKSVSPATPFHLSNRGHPPHNSVWRFLIVRVAGNN